MEDSEEIPVILLDTKTKKRLFEAWKYCLIGKVMGKTIGFKFKSTKVHELRKLKGSNNTGT